jgi:hypothetical protein
MGMMGVMPQQQQQQAAMFSMANAGLMAGSQPGMMAHSMMTPNMMAMSQTTTKMTTTQFQQQRTTPSSSTTAFNEFANFGK